MPLGSGLLEEGDQVRSVLGLLEPGEHLSTQGPSKLSITAVLEPEPTGAERQQQAQSQRSPSNGQQARQPACLRLQRWSLAGGRVRTILVPGMYAFGLSRYMYRCSSPHVMPVAKRR